ncbi:MAG: hypothetical protein IJW70_01965 [Clostridia bacterium]|nr:hypothetical protein [Clostridia bacterium]
MPSRKQKRENIRQYKYAVRQKETLLLQKKSLSEDLRDHVILSVFFLALACLVILVGAFLKRPAVLVGTIPTTAAAILLACFAFRSASVYRKMRQIMTSAAEEKKVCVQKIKLWMIPGHRGTSWIRCVVLIDESGEKYYYAYPAGHTPISGFAKVIRARCLYQTVYISCYKNTRFISHFDFTDHERSPS